VKSYPEHVALFVALNELGEKVEPGTANEGTVIALVERYCVDGLGKKVSEQFTASLLTSGGLRYRSPFVFPWNKSANLFVYDIRRKEVCESSRIVQVRYELAMDINHEKAQRRPHAYGKRDVLEQQIAVAALKI
jgi:hypothetical protein